MLPGLRGLPVPRVRVLRVALRELVVLQVPEVRELGVLRELGVRAARVVARLRRVSVRPVRHRR